MQQRPIGLNEWINLHSTSENGLDEDGCYADAGSRASRAVSRTVRM